MVELLPINSTVEIRSCDALGVDLQLCRRRILGVSTVDSQRMSCTVTDTIGMPQWPDLLDVPATGGIRLWTGVDADPPIM